MPLLPSTRFPCPLELGWEAKWSAGCAAGSSQFEPQHLPKPGASLAAVAAAASSGGSGSGAAVAAAASSGGSGSGAAVAQRRRNVSAVLMGLVRGLSVCGPHNAGDCRPALGSCREIALILSIGGDGVLAGRCGADEEETLLFQT